MAYLNQPQPANTMKLNLALPKKEFIEKSFISEIISKHFFDSKRLTDVKKS